MLRILKSPSSKFYENEFFRKMAIELSNTFALHQWDGILIGMPSCMTREDLQIDCLLITDSQIIIIDFKNYSGKLKLPDEKDFAKNKWSMDEVTVKGGSSINPYIQVRRQRKKFIEEMNKFFSTVHNSAIHTLVCFQDKVTIDGEIPRKYRLGFDIVDAFTYVHKIEDIVDILAEEATSFLSDDFQRIFMNELFKANEYITQEVSQAEPKLKALPVIEPAAVDVQQKVEEFLKNSDQVMVITGPTSSGKTSLIPSIRDWAFSEEYVNVPVYAYSNRLRTKMLSYHPEIEDVDSLFGELFDFQQEYFDEDYRKIIPLKNNVSDDENQYDPTLYIIDDCQLLSNNHFDPDSLQFGSGHLIDDLFMYIDLANHPERKLILIGDMYKIGYASKEESVLNLQFLASYLSKQKIDSSVQHVALQQSSSANDIVTLCNEVADQIEEEQYNYLNVENKDNIKTGGKDLQREALNQAYLYPFDHKILTYTNEKATTINHYIKKQLLKNGTTIQNGDYIVFNASIQAYSNCDDDFEQAVSLPKRINNGEFGKVTRTYMNQTITITAPNEVCLSLVPCDITFSDNSVVTIYVLKNYLLASKSTISKEEQAAIHMQLRILEKEAYAQEPFEYSSEFRSMRADSESYVAIIKDGSTVYRSKKDKRLLTTYEKAYRERIKQNLQTPDHLYFKLLNAAKVRYAWAMTVNKGMAYSFEHVYFDTDQGENRGLTNREYFKWLYTGFSTVNNSLSLINWQPISPFMNTVFEKRLTTPKKSLYWFIADETSPLSSQIQQALNECLISKKWYVKTMAERPYLEIVTITNEQEDLKLHVYYDSKNRVKMPKYQSGNKQIFDEINRLFISEPKEEYRSFPHNLQPFFSQVKKDFAFEGMTIKYSIKAEWIIEMILEKENETATVEMFFNLKGLISKCYLVDGNEELFESFHQFLKIK